MELILAREVYGLSDDVSRFLVTILVVVGCVFIVCVHPDMSNAMLPIMTLTIGHFFGRNQKVMQVRNRQPGDRRNAE